MNNLTVVSLSISDRFVKSGNWQIKEIKAEISETDHGNCCPFKFSQAVYTLSMKRKSLYYTFYLTIPCVMLTILALSSFLIHVESGERIGFVTTVLLAMTVFLLVIPSWLPVTSESLPVLGVLLEGTMIIITLILFANIGVLRVYFLDGPPPDWVQKICRFCTCGRKRGRNVQRIHVLTAENSAVKKSSTATTTTEIEMIESKYQREASTPTAEDGHQMEGKDYTWKSVSTKMDRAFFVAFIIISIIAYSLYIQSTLS